MQKIVLGHIVNPLSDKKAQNIPDGALLLKSKKRKNQTIYVIEAIGKSKDLLKQAGEVCEVLDFSGQVILPGFFDMHFHWVQDDVREMPKANLLTWLEKYTFPSEAKFKNKTYAKKKAKVFFQRLASTGTLGGACYSSVHDHALDYAMDEAVGDLVIGNVLMTMNSPKSLIQTSKAAIQSVKKLSTKYKKRYCLTPRFAIATDPQTMRETTKIAKKQKCFMQTHLSETPNEIEFVTSMYKEFPKFKKIETYTDIYDKVGMLGPRTIMGHGIHLQKSELKKLSKTQTAIAHCPTSNAPIKQKGLGSGLFDFKTIEKHKIPWALGSDIGGGPFLSMFDVMRSFVDQNTKAEVQGATFTKALFRATLAGAKILGVDKKAGNFSEGKEANFMVLKKIKLNNSKSAEVVLERIINSKKSKRAEYDKLPERVYYHGELIHSSIV